jgi:hypothetical protein
MSKQRKRNSKPATLSSDADFLAEQMDAVAAMMWTVAERMEYFAGFYNALKDRALRVGYFSIIINKWAREVREQANKQNGGGK